MVQRPSVFGGFDEFAQQCGVAADIDRRVLVGRVVREARQLQVEQAQHHLRRGDLAAQRRRPPRGDGRHVAAGIAVLGAALGDHVGDVLEEHFRGSAHARPPFVSMAQSRMAMASASLSSAGSKPRARMAAIIACLSALPLPVA